MMAFYRIYLLVCLYLLIYIFSQHPVFCSNFYDYWKMKIPTLMLCSGIGEKTLCFCFSYCLVNKYYMNLLIQVDIFFESQILSLFYVCVCMHSKEQLVPQNVKLLFHISDPNFKTLKLFKCLNFIFLINFIHKI